MAAQTCSNSFRQRTNQRRARVKGGHAALHACPSDTQNTAQGSSKPLWALPAQFPDHSAQLDAKQLVPRKNPPQICHVRSHFSGSFLPSRHSSSPSVGTTFEQPQKPQNTAQSSSKPLWALPAQLPDHSAQLDAKQLVPRKNPPEICHVRSYFSGSFLTSRHRSNPLGAAQLMLGAAHGNSDARKLVPSKNPPEI